MKKPPQEIKKGDRFTVPSGPFRGFLAEATQDAVQGNYSI
jgi:transcription antitermination factor NusG